MATDGPLYVKIIDELKLGDPPVSVRDAMARWNYSEGHARRVMGWMADQQQPPTMRKLSNVSPSQWERI
jgi:hypothetical protein